MVFAIPEGKIDLDSEVGVALGFTSNRFGGYLWRKGDEIIISLIFSVHPGLGHLSRLFAQIESLGYRVAVPTPSVQMQSILVKKGFKRELREDPLFEKVEVWLK